MGTDLELALDILKQSRLTLADMAEMKHERINVLRLEAETHRQVCREYIAEANREFTRTRRLGDPQMFARVQHAERLHAQRCSIAHATFAERKATRVPSECRTTAERERDEGRETARRLAAEVERLQAELAEARKTKADERLNRAFFETAKFILADSTFTRMLAKAKELAR